MPDNDTASILNQVLDTDAHHRGPAARLVHLTIAALAVVNDNRVVETTVHTLVHLTGMLPVVIEAVLGHNELNVPLIPADVHLVDDVVIVHLLPAVNDEAA